ncbi:hypothetical protein Ancab_005390, partial [Ancistrocladus abbreviatus]
AWCNGHCALFLRGDVGRQVHAQIVKCVVEEDFTLPSTILDSYVKWKRADYARRVFDRMWFKKVICSTLMKSGYMSGVCAEDAAEISEKSAEKDVIIFNAVIEGYSKSIETAKKSI